LKVLVYEHLCSGGFAEQPISASLLAEGYAMLQGIVADFKLAGHEVTVLLDSRLSKLNPPLRADYIVPIIYADEPIKFLLAAGRINDALYIIAPESNQILQTMVAHAESTKKLVLNSPSDAIAAVADKAALYAALQKRGVPTPKTLLLKVNDPQGIKQKIGAELGYPVLFKPVDGAGCSGITLLRSETQIVDALEKIKSESKNPQFIAQQYLQGEAASVSLIADGKKALPLSLNSQQVNLEGSPDQSSYCGGAVPLAHPLKEAAFLLARRAVELFGLRGYVGLDLIFADGALYVVDVNARLTTSYVGVRQVVKLNVAQALIDAAEGKLPNKFQTEGAVCFQKIFVPQPTQETYRRTLELDGVVSPPFPIEGNRSAHALLLGYGESLAAAQVQLSRANKRLLDIIC
jgi:predicted ATP-grasp superfamily ATP-dependent carboligase